MPSHEFAYWQAYSNIEPFGPQRDNYHAGLIASTIANVHSKKTWKPSDFMIRTAEENSEQNGKDFLAGLRRLSKPKPRDQVD